MNITLFTSQLTVNNTFNNSTWYKVMSKLESLEQRRSQTRHADRRLNTAEESRIREAIRPGSTEMTDRRMDEQRESLISLIWIWSIGRKDRFKPIYCTSTFSSLFHRNPEATTGDKKKMKRNDNARQFESGKKEEKNVSRNRWRLEHRTEKHRGK